MLLKIFTSTIVIVMFIGCGGATPASNSAVSSEKIAKSSVMDIIDEADDDELQHSTNKELYFGDTHNKIFYSKSHENSLDFHTKILLRRLFDEAKHKLPRKSRRKKLNIALKAENKKLLKAAQDFILANKKYNLTNTDKETMRVLKKILKEEKDSLYKGRSKITTKEKSDVILFLGSKKNKNTITINAKLIAKNGTILARKSNTIYLNSGMSNSKQEWVEVYVPRNDGPPQVFEVMRNPVTQKEYYGSGENVSVSNISFGEANNFCQKTMKAELISPYVFENARKSLAISRPTSPVNSEMIASYDEEEDESYYVDGDHLEASDGTIVMFDWNSEKYYAVSNVYRSKKMTFRCMRAK